MIPFKYPKVENLFVRSMEGPLKGKVIPGVFKLPEFQLLRPDYAWRFTEKIHGQNIRIRSYIEGDERKWEIGGRTDQAQLSVTLIKNVNDLMEQVNPVLCEKLQGDVIFFGEGYGAGINRGGGYSDSPMFILFDIANIGSRCWWNWDNLCAFAESVGFEVVPEIDEVHTLSDAIEKVKRGFITQVGKKLTQAEGVVGRLCPELYHFRNGGLNPLRFKIKTEDFA